MTVLITGVAGFIGYHTAMELLLRGEKIIGIDSLNDYYDVSIKHARLERLKEISPAFAFHHLNIADHEAVRALILSYPDIDRVVHLAAQAGVRYSLINPWAYSEANLIGHLSMLEACRALGSVKHFVYASSSSVYGSNKKLPFSVEDRTDSPIALYAATKKSCELMSHSYSHLYGFPSTGLRYFTVYGPWGRPDMSAFLFTKALLRNEEIPIFNNGDMRRNYTYIDDIVAGTISCLDSPAQDPAALHRLYNIGNDRSEPLMHFVATLENLLDKKARLRFEPMQQGDVKETLADITPATRDFGFTPKTHIEEGLARFVSWYKEYYHV